MKKLISGAGFFALIVSYCLLITSCEDPVKPQEYTIYSTSGPNGKISPAGLTTVSKGANAVFTVTPNPGFTLCSLLVNDVAVAPVTEFTFTNVVANHTIRAVFKELLASDTMTITSSAGSNGTILPLGNVKIANGANAVFVLVANTGFKACSLFVDSVSVTVKDTFVFQNVKSNHTIRVTFKSDSEIDTIKATNINTIATVFQNRRYVVVGNLSLTSELIIQPGAILKFAPGSGITVTTTGSISAMGTATAPITFTSVKDDTHGGDLNGDGTATTPAMSDWAGIVVESNNGNFQFCRFLYGGQHNSVLKIKNLVATVITNCSFVNNNGGPLGGDGALDVSQVGLTSTIKNNVFYGNTVPLSISPNFSLDTSNCFSIENVGQPVKNTFQCITVAGDNVTSNVTWAETELPFFINRRLTLENAASVLNLSPGIVLKFDRDLSLTVNAQATLNSVGTENAPVYFTSIKNDSIGGDANRDSTKSIPSANGDWNSIWIESSKSILKHCTFSYGGSTLKSVVELRSGSSVQLENCTFVYNNGGLLDGNGVLNAANTSLTTKISNCRFFGNSLPLSIPACMTLDSTNSFSSVDRKVKNIFNCIAVNSVSTTGTDISVQTSWTETEVPFFRKSPLAIANGGVLSLAPGVMIKMSSNTWIHVTLTGTLNAIGDSAKPIYITSIKDDAIGGDVNGDGSQSSPAIGDWSNIQFDDNGSSLKYCVISYGGGTNLNSAVLVGNNSSLIVENCTFAYNNGGTLFGRGALSLWGAKTTTVLKNNIFYGNTLPVSINVNLSVDSSNIFFNPAKPTQGNTYNCISVANGNIGVAVSWLETEVAFVPCGGLVITDGASLTLGPNVVIKFSPTGSALDIMKGGTLNDAAAGVVLTSYKDDTVKGDSNGDGSATTPAEGDWKGVLINQGFDKIDKEYYLYDGDM